MVGRIAGSLGPALKVAALLFAIAVAPGMSVAQQQALTGAAAAEIRARYAPTLGEDVVNRILGGKREDLILLTPHVLSPNAKVAAFCLLGGSQPPDELLDYAKKRFADGDALEFARKDCGRTGPWTSVDLVVLERGRLLSDPQLATTVFEALSKKAATLYDIADSTAFSLRKQRAAGEAGQPLPDLRDGKLTGFGMLIVGNSSRRLCASKSDDLTFLRREAERMSRAVTDPAIRAVLQQDIDLFFIEDLYLKAKGNGCRYLLGRHAVLRTVANALADDPVQITVGPGWIPERELPADFQSHR